MHACINIQDLFLPPGTSPSNSLTIASKSKQCLNLGSNITNSLSKSNMVRNCINIKQAEKLKSREMKEGWMKNDECWRMNDEGWRFQVVEGFCDWRTDERTNERTFVNVESLSQLKETSVIYKLLQCKYLSVHVYILNIIWVYTLSCILYSIHFILLLSKVLAFLSKWSPSIYIFKYFNIS